MNKVILGVLGVLALVNVAQAASQSTSATVSESSTRLSLSPGLQIISGDGASVTYFGAGIGVSTPVVENLYVGVDAGLYFHSEDSSFGSASQKLIAPHGTVYYRFGDSSMTLRPYLGLAAGPTFSSLSIGDASETTTLFQLMGRPGLDIALTDSMTLGAEPRVGLIDGDFAFLPQLSLNVGL